MAKRLREESIKKYMQSPNICRNGHKVILVQAHEKASDVRKKKFCNRHCSSVYNNKHRKKTQKYCLICGVPITGKNRKYCSKECRQEASPIEEISSKTKGQMFAERSYFKARSAICKHARITFMKSDRPKFCKICGYSIHIEVCHLKPVSKFVDDALISEINGLDNLIALCRNHHWEFDHKLLKLDKLK